MKSKTKAIVVLLIVFLLGGGTGAAAMFAVARRQDAELYGENSLENHDRRRLRAMIRRLDLDDEQTERVREILMRHRQEREQLRKELRSTCMKPLADLRDQVDDEIASVLTAEQRERLGEVRAREHPRRHQRHHRGRR